MVESSKKPVIFLAFANDRDDRVKYLRNLPEELRQIRETLQRAQNDELCELVELANATAEEIFRVFQDPKYRDRIAVFHYGGHANGYQLLLESASGSSRAADAGGLAAFFGQQRGLELVFLNGCSTQQQVQGLLDANVAVVIATSSDIDDLVARHFSELFYQGLAGGASIRRAFNEAEAAVQTSRGGDTRGLYFGTDDDSQRGSLPWKLHPPHPGNEADDAAEWSLVEAVDDPLWNLPLTGHQKLPLVPFRDLDRYESQHAELFFGRGELIRELYDALTSAEADPVVLFYGQSGVGKSSVLDAGVCPRLDPTHEVQVVRRDFERSLRETLHATIGHTDEPIRDAWRQRERQSGKPLIIVLDQVEEIFTRPRAKRFTTEQNPDATELTGLIHAARSIFLYEEDDPAGKLVLAFRKEWLSDIEDEFGKDWSLQKISARPLRHAEIVLAIRGPSTTGPLHAKRLRKKYKLEVDDEVPGRIADLLLSDPDSPVAPMLQVILCRMWEKVRNQDPPKFTVETFESLDIRGNVLGDFLHRQLLSIEQSVPGGDKPGLLLDLLEYHTTPRATASEHSEAETRADYCNPDYPDRQATVDDLIRRCMDAKLLTIPSDDSEIPVRRTRLTHDTLAPHVKAEVQISNKPGQQARRLLMLKTRDDLTHDLLTIPQLRRLQRGRHGTRNYSPDIESMIRRSKRRLIIQAGVIAALFITILLVSWRQINNQRDETIAAKLVGAFGEFHQFLIDPLTNKSRAVAVAKRTVRESTNVDEQFKSARAAMILAQFANDAEAVQALLGRHLQLIDQNEMTNLQSALKSVSLDRPFPNPEEVPLPIRVKACALLLSIGQAAEIPSQWYAPTTDPTTRTYLIYHLHRWMGDQKLFTSSVAQNGSLPRDLESLVYAALRFVDVELFTNQLRSDLVALLLRTYRMTPHASVRSAAFATLREFDRQNPGELKDNDALRQLVAEKLVLPENADFERRRIKIDDTDTDVLDFVRLQMPDFESDKPQTVNGVVILPANLAELKQAFISTRKHEARTSTSPTDAIFEHEHPVYAMSYWISTTEIDQNLMRAFRTFRKESQIAEYDNISTKDEELYIDGSPVATRFPARNVCWLEAIEFCNWLTRRDVELGVEQECYVRFDEGEGENRRSGWRYEPDRKGYRLPTEIEWEFACRAWSTGDFWFGTIDSNDLADKIRHDCAWSNSEALGRGPLESASLLPNAFGLFDMHGNVRELCWKSISPEKPLIAFDKELRLAMDGAYDVDIFESMACETELLGDDERNAAFGLRIVRTIETNQRQTK